MDRRSEVDIKLNRVQSWLDAQDLDAVLFASHGGFAWITGGARNHVNLARGAGAGGVLVTRESVTLLADSIQSARLVDDELAGLDWPVSMFPWWDSSLHRAASERMGAQRFVADTFVRGGGLLRPSQAVALRNPLLPTEVERYRALGEQVGVVLTHAALHCRPGLSEHQLAGMLGGALMDWGIEPLVTLVAVDDRAWSHPHPLPTNQRLERYAVLTVTARQHGLHVTATRSVHFGPVPVALKEQSVACATVDAAFLTASRPGAALQDVFRSGCETYSALGIPDGWLLQPQGGPTGYEPWELMVSPGGDGIVLDRQAFAWTPFLPGARSGDTILATEQGAEVLSATPDLPVQQVEVAGQPVSRPAILER